MSSRDITSAIRRHSATLTMSSWTEPETPTRRDDQFELSDLTPTIGRGGSGSSSSRGLRRDRRLSDMSAVSADLGLRHTYVDTVLIAFLFFYTDPNWDTDASCPCSAIHRTCPRTMIKTCWPRCKIQLGEVSELRVRREYSSPPADVDPRIEMMLAAEEEEQNQKQ